MGGEVGGLQVDTSDTQLCVDSCGAGRFRDATGWGLPRAGATLAWVSLQRATWREGATSVSRAALAGEGLGGRSGPVSDVSSRDPVQGVDQALSSEHRWLVASFLCSFEGQGMSFAHSFLCGTNCSGTPSFLQV